jgi:hypothetical protein
VTIAAGFLFSGGVVLCADTQETVTGISKRSTPKLIFKPSERDGKDSAEDLMIVMAGAGEGPFTDKIVDRVWGDIEHSTSFDEACASAEASIKETYRHYGEIYQAGYLPTSDIVCGVKMQGRSKLLTARGPIVNEVSGYSSVGTGYYMADFLAGKMHNEYLTGPQVVLLAAYILFQCTEHVDGCGGDAHIAVLNNGGRSMRINPMTTEFTMHQLKDLDKILSRLLLLAPDYEMTASQLDLELSFANRVLKDAHEHSASRKKLWDKLSRPKSITVRDGKLEIEYDEDLDVTPSTPQTSPDQQ